MHSPDFIEINEPTIAILPPGLSERVYSHCESKALEPFWGRFMDDDAFCERLMRASDNLADIVFDPNNPGWGVWPIDVEECAGLGFILGVRFEQLAERIITELPEEFVTKIEAKSRAESRGLCDLLLDELTERKEAAGSKKRGEA
jgi:hypothetical protein